MNSQSVNEASSVDAAMTARTSMTTMMAVLAPETKLFFSEEKNQKTFAGLSPGSPRQKRKSFCVFFQKEALLT
jgi:hypothetical protein